MNKARLHGIFYVAAGIAILAASYWLMPWHLPWWLLFMVIPGPALVLVGAMMIARPGEAVAGEFDFTDWLESRPLPERMVYYAVGGIGLALGFVYVLWLLGVLSSRAHERRVPPPG